MHYLKHAAIFTLAVFSAACKHPLEPVGEGDILSLTGTRDCLLEAYQARLPACDENRVVDGPYTETYTAVPRPGWKFLRWENYCQAADTNECPFDIPADLVTLFAAGNAAPLRAIFAPLPFEPELSAPPTNFSGTGAAFAADVSYGPDARNTFDILMPPSDGPTPLVIYVHGGGFTGGAKESGFSATFARDVGLGLLASGVAYATVEYRLLQPDNEDEGVIKPLGDVRRALQFIRLHAESFNIDPDRIALFGNSAGAGTSLWLATHDDMADTRSTDPVARMSSRIIAAGARATQASYDVVRWEEVFAEFGLTLELIAQVQPIQVQRLLDFYAISSQQELYDNPEILAYRADVDMLGLMDADDAPIWVQNPQADISIPLNSNTLYHHGFHARELRDRALAVGLENVVYVPALGISDPGGESLTNFLLRHLEVSQADGSP